MTDEKQTTEPTQPAQPTALPALPEQYIYCRGGRTGRKVHKAIKGFSSTLCGHWVKCQISNYEVTPEQAAKMTKCERCF